MKKFCTLFAVTLLLFWASLAFGQRDGVPSFTVSDDHEFDTINLTTLVPTIHIPILTKAAGPLPGSIVLESPQSCQIVPGPNSNTSWSCGNSDTNEGALFYFVPGGAMAGMTTAYSYTFSSPCYTITVIALVGSDNLSSYPISPTTLHAPSTCGTQTATVTTNDGTGITATISTASFSPTQPPSVTALQNTDGWTGGSTVTDAFGNTIKETSTTFTDSLGAITNLTQSGGAPPTSYQYTDTTGTSQTVSFSLGTSHTFNPLSGTTCNTASSGNGVTPVNEIDYPDSTKFSFTWQSNGGGLSGLISSFTLRTGGQISYTYGTLTAPCSGGWYYATLSRQTPDGTTSYSASTASGITTTTVLDPGQNKVVYTFFGGPNGATETKDITRYQNTGTVASPTYTTISYTKYCYNNLSCSTAPTFPVTQLDTYEYTYNGATQVQMSHDVKLYDSTYGLLTSDAVTDSINSQTITTTYVYGTYSSGTCSAITNTAVVDHPCTVTTKNGSTWLAESTYTYNANGALTSSSVCLSSTCTGSSALTTTYTPTTQGTYSAIQGPNGQTVNYTYGSCNSLMPTDITTTVNSVAIDNKATWNCDAGLVTDRTDPNSNEADYTYDSMNRPSTIHDFMGDTNTTSFAYGTPTLDHVKVTDNIGVVSYQYNDGLGRPTNYQVCQTTGCSNLDTHSKSYAWNGTNFETKTYVPCVKTTLNSACTTVALTSDVNPIVGLTLSTDANSGTLTYVVNSKDFSVTAGPAPSQENTKVLQTEIDGFGRITSTCALTSSGYNGRVSCSQTMGNSGTLTSNVYSFDATTGAPKVVTTRGSQTHTTITDSIGRVTSAATPEAGTATNVYDTISSANNCKSANYTSAGDLLQHNNADSSYSCYIYDGLHRITDIANSLTAGPCKRFRYDSTANKLVTAPTGYPSSPNIVGRLMEVATDNCSGFPITAITDEWFAYDKDGNITDMFQSSTNSGGYYHTTAGYNADGTVTSADLSGASTFTFGVDGEDRPLNMELGSTWIVGTSSTTGVSYDAASRPLTVPLSTSGDQDAFTYDNVGNMTDFKFTVNSTNLEGALTWNSIGSLNKLVITDGFNSGGTQTCTFGTSTVEGYDDVGRLLDDNCGSTVWHQSFTYDQYDNITKTGNPGTSWNPGYSSTTNEMTGSTYNGNGDLTYDGVNSYSFNPYGQLTGAVSGNHTVSCGTSGHYCPTYDAMGRIVEINNGGTYSQILYSPIGKLAYMNGQSVITWYVPAPGGGDFYMTNSIMYFLHPDWLGSKRLSTSLVGRAEQYDSALAPYGENYNYFGTVVPDFTGLTDDVFGTGTNTAAGLLTTPNRQLQPEATRWLSPDPAHAGWNAYAYPTDPNTQTDRSGLGPADAGCCHFWDWLRGLFDGKPNPYQQSASSSRPTNDLLSYRDTPRNNHPVVNGHQYVSGDVHAAGGPPPMGLDFALQFFFGSKRQNLQNDLYLSSIGASGMSIGILQPVPLENPLAAGASAGRLFEDLANRADDIAMLGDAHMDKAQKYIPIIRELGVLGQHNTELAPAVARVRRLMTGGSQFTSAGTGSLDLVNAIIEAGGGLPEHFNNLGPGYGIRLDALSRAHEGQFGFYFWRITELDPNTPFGTQ